MEGNKFILNCTVVLELKTTNISALIPCPGMIIAEDSRYTSQQMYKATIQPLALEHPSAVCFTRTDYYGKVQMPC